MKKGSEINLRGSGESSEIKGVKANEGTSEGMHSKHGETGTKQTGKPPQLYLNLYT